MATQLENKAYIQGSYEGQELTMPSNLVRVDLVDIAVRKRASRTVWGDGELTFTVDVVNTGDTALLSAIFRDNLDPTCITLVSGSVMVNGAASAYDYNPVLGDLTINLPDIAPGMSLEVSFRVVRRA